MDGYLTRAESWQLIGLVKERRKLWDLTDPDFMKQNGQYDLWNEVAAEMKKPIQKVKIRWRSLRDRYRKELKKFSSIGVNPQKNCKWAYFQKMAFMKNTVLKSRVSPGIIDISGSNPDTEETDDGGSLQAVTVLTSPDSSSLKNQILEQQHLVSHSTPQKELKVPKTETIPSENGPNGSADRVFENEERHLKCCAKDDGDYEFLMSLLPHIRDIPKSRKLILRAKLLQTLIEEQWSLAQENSG